MTNPVANQPRRRGTCPGVLAPMQVGDGFLLRVRVPAGVLPAEHARRIADLGDRYGNGLIDLSQRGNLQLRGITADALEPVTDALRAMGYVSSDAASEAVRNVLCSPTAGLDLTAAMDVRAVARTLDARLAEDTALRGLPSKFGWLVCGGGIGHLADSSTDVRFDAVDAERFRVSLGGTLAKAAPLGLCRADDVANVGSALGRAFLDLRASLPEPPRRMAGLASAIGTEPFATRLSPLISPPPPSSRTKLRFVLTRQADRRSAESGGGSGWGQVSHLMDLFGSAEPPHPNLLPGGEKESCVGKAPAFLTTAFPFGRLTAGTLAALASACTEIRITPWRALLLVAPAADAEGIAKAHGAILSHTDRRLKLTACSGAGGCDVGTTDTHATALAIADRAGPLLDHVRMVHVSGCAKGCAHPAIADVTLTARDGVYDVALNAKPGDDSPHTGLSPADAVARVADLLTEESTGA
ncbi:precorrin-3B synthase [Azospirillum sp. TSH7]|uniref:precorrin-3B synthase n=1 Tax=unclassified Azospirillum TaxID=2630922 RepID=UPI000D60B6E5|nr:MULTISPECIES: precorrin-3B synthase [unclassified Azospirillum]PWC58001.1 precorrin-3B synthase [Azospirillum sp. TSH20]PWC68534.1 precorrin-3B synthase [Azospirillum sp. TSH7]